MKKSIKFNLCYYTILLVFTLYIILDTFVFSEVYSVIENTNITYNEIQQESIGNITLEPNLYEDDNIKIVIEEYEECE